MKKILLGISFALIILLGGSAHAQYIPKFIDASGTVSTVSTQALAAVTTVNRIFLLVQNVSSNNLGVTFDGTVAAIGSPGTITLAPGQGVIFQGNVPAGAIEVIGSGSGTTYTIKYL